MNDDVSRTAFSRKRDFTGVTEQHGTTVTDTDAGGSSGNGPDPRILRPKPKNP